MIGSSQKIITMKSSRTVEDPYIIVNSAHIPSMIREIQRRHALSMQAPPSLMEFIGKERQKYTIIPKRVNVVSTSSGMEYGMSYPF